MSSVDRTASLDTVIRDRHLTPLFQPILNLRGGGVFAVEALIRGPVGELHQPSALFAEALTRGRHCDLEIAALDTVLARADSIDANIRLFLNISPQTLATCKDWPLVLMELCRSHRVEPNRCVLELTERSLIEDYSGMRDRFAELRLLGFEFAIDDLGAGYSGLRMWSELRPEFVKIDQYFMAELDSDPVKTEFVRSIVTLGRTVGSFVIAEGVETPQACARIIDLEVDAAQGFLFARPANVVPEPAALLGLLPTSSPGAAANSAVDLIERQVPVSPTLLIKDFVPKLQAEPERRAFPVVGADEVPLGVIWRDRFLLRYSRFLQPELLQRKPVTEIMDPAPLVVDVRLRLEEMSRLVTQRPRRHAAEQFIITGEGRYLGMGDPVDILERMTRQKLRVAAQSNPLTSLPGNIPIMERLDALIREQRPFVACYADLDHFKAFNDEYGFARGDQLLLHLAQLLRSVVTPRVDFLGHIGGDDFVLTLSSPDWLRRLRGLVCDFDATAPGFYSEEHRRDRLIRGIDRSGRRRHFGLVSLSVAVLPFDAAIMRNAEEVSDRLRLVKRESKARAGSCLLMLDGEAFVDLSAPDERRQIGAQA